MHLNMRSPVTAVTCAVLLSFRSFGEAASDLQAAPGYVGLRDPDANLPAYATLLTVYLITPVGGRDYSVRLIDSRGERVFLLERLERDASGQPRSSEVIAAAKVPRVPRGFALALGVCYRGDVHDPDIIALAKKEDTHPMWQNIRAAWRADVSRRQFRAVDSRHLKCENEDYGKD
jgi:hypothetical protein